MVIKQTGSAQIYSTLEGDVKIVSHVMDEVLRGEFLLPFGLVEVSKKDFPKAIDDAVNFLNKSPEASKGVIYFKQILDSEKIALGYTIGSKFRDLGN